VFDKIYSDPFARRVVRNWARRLCQRPVFVGVEREDLEQELWAGLSLFDPQIAHRNKLIVTIVARAPAKLVRAASTKMRVRRGQSLEAMPNTDDDSAEQLAVPSLEYSLVRLQPTTSPTDPRTSGLKRMLSRSILADHSSYLSRNFGLMTMKLSRPPTSSSYSSIGGRNTIPSR
jgi:hypothetical protein